MKTKQLLTKCLCGSVRGKITKYKKIPIIVCDDCGVQRQNVKMDETELNEYYEKQYHADFGDKEYAHDYEVAQLRLGLYRIKAETMLLDVGSGNGAFVEAARAQEIDAYGCEVATTHSRTEFLYNDHLCNIHFPTDYFDVITIHDVLEHMMDPRRVLEECFRILKQEGTLIVDFPRFFDKAGKHHWKLIEHLWFLNNNQLKGLLIDAGFEVESVKHPIPSKIVFKVTKPVQYRPTVMIPPGIGDTYWALLKLQAFLDEKKLGIPDVYISSPSGYSKDHSIEFVRRCPFINVVGYRNHAQDANMRELYNNKKGRTCIENQHGIDYFVAYNGRMASGASLEEINPQYKSDWDYPMFQSFEERQYEKEAKEKYGKYTVAYFIPHGPYSQWLNEFSIEDVFKVLQKIAKQMKHKIILVGAYWDENTLETKLMSMDKDNVIVNLVGKTDIDQAFGLVRGAEGVFGYPSGMTIMATTFRKPTLMLWNSYYEERFWWNTCNPSSRHNWYEAINTKDATVDGLFTRYKELVNGRPDSGTVAAPLSTKKAPAVKTEVVEKKRVRKGDKPLSVVCILKVGGDFTEEHVNILHHQVQKRLTVPFEFVCITDSKKKKQIKVDRIVKMIRSDLPGMWSKLELFRPDLFEGKVLYLDLDTIITGNIDELVSNINGTFQSLKGWNPHRSKKLCSAIMAWSHDYGKIYERLEEEVKDIFSKKVDWWEEQDFIEKGLKELYSETPTYFQDTFPVVSFKRHCRINGVVTLPANARIVCFHGKPRPEEVVDEISWVKENWK